MIKKIICVVSIFAFLVCTTGCLEDDVVNQDSLVCELLQDLSEKSYLSTEISIVTTTEFAQLSANYFVTQNNVTYSIEQLNLLPSCEDINGLLQDYKTLITGEAVIKDGEVIELDGNSITLPSDNELMGKFNFDEKNFQNIVVESGLLTADVISPSQFYGTAVDMQDVKIAVKYSETSIEEIVVSYETEKSTVQAVYEFES